MSTSYYMIDEPRDTDRCSCVKRGPFIGVQTSCKFIFQAYPERNILTKSVWENVLSPAKNPTDMVVDEYGHRQFVVGFIKDIEKGYNKLELRHPDQRGRRYQDSEGYWFDMDWFGR